LNVYEKATSEVLRADMSVDGLEIAFVLQGTITSCAASAAVVVGAVARNFGDVFMQP
jgi:hypothetical protein